MFTTQCSGDLGIEVEGRIVAQAFILQSSHGRWGLNVYDLVRGGPHEVCTIDAGLNKMLAIARREEEIPDMNGEPSGFPKYPSAEDLA